jgi:hypothetical protein
VKPERSEERYLFNEKWRAWLEGDLQHSLLGLGAEPVHAFMLTQVSARGHLPANRGELFGWFVDYLLLQRERLAPEAAEQLKDRSPTWPSRCVRGGGTGCTARG